MLGGGEMTAFWRTTRLVALEHLTWTFSDLDDKLIVLDSIESGVLEQENI